MTTLFRDLAVAFAATNIFFLSTWIDYEKAHTPEFYFVIGGPPDAKYGRSIGILIAVITCCVFGALQFRRHTKSALPRTLLESGFLVGYLLLFLDAGEMFVALLATEGHHWVAFALFVFLNTITIAIFLKGRQAALRLAETVLLIFLPFSFFKFIEATSAQRLGNPGADFDNKARRATPISKESPRRIVWILFDGMDQSITFADRPTRLSLPEFDRLRMESVYADRALPTGRQTINVILSLLSGQKVSSVSPLGPSDARLEYADGSATELTSEARQLYAEMRRSGLRTAVVGGYLPYCRLFGSDLDFCHWEPTPDAFPAHAWYSYLTSMELLPRAREIFWRQLVQLFGVFDRSLLPGVRARQEEEQAILLADRHATMFRKLRDAALRLLEEGSNQFVMIHVPIPHPPPIYDSASGKVGNYDSNTYLDNYALSDAFLGQVRASLTATSRWNETTLLVTSDHSLRPEVWEPTVYWTDELRSVASGRPLKHVPFMLKLSGQTAGIAYRRDFDSIVIHDLLVGLASGEVATADDVVGLLDRTAVD